MFDTVVLSVRVVDCQHNNTIIWARLATSALQQRTSSTGCRLAQHHQSVVNILAQLNNSTSRRGFLRSNFQHTQQQRAGGEWFSIPDLTNNYLDEDQFEQVSFYDVWGEDNMRYPYSKYRGDANAEAHIGGFLTKWEINHGAQRLSAIHEYNY